MLQFVDINKKSMKMPKGVTRKQAIQPETVNLISTGNTMTKVTRSRKSKKHRQYNDQGKQKP
jgi:hypothetical protein